MPFCRIPNRWPALLAGLLAASLVSAEVRVIPNQVFEKQDASQSAWTLPEKNDYLVLRPYMAKSKFSREVPSDTLFSAVGESVVSELKKTLAVDASFDPSDQSALRDLRPPTLVKQLVDLGRGRGVRTVVALDMEIKSLNPKATEKHYGIPVTRNEGMTLQWAYPTATLVVSGLFVDTALGTAVVQVLGEGDSTNANLAPFLQSRDTDGLRSALAAETIAMAQRAASDFAFESRLRHLWVMRPLLHAAADAEKKNQAALSIGSTMGVQEKDTFSAYRQEGGEWIPVAKLTAVGVGAEDTQCKVQPIKKEVLTAESVVIPVDLKVSGGQFK